jgi:FMN phosphatase YigB (HAD superfamily)
MPECVYVFMDFDNTLSDSDALRKQYVQELTSILNRDFGGETGAWEAALSPALDASQARYQETFFGNPLAGYTDWLAQERVRITQEVFGAMGITPPEGEPLGDFAKRVQFEALTCCNAALPGAEEAMRGLFEAGHRTQIASAWESEYLFAALIGAGIESYTESKFGGDLVNCAKEGSEFYQRIFAACQIRPSQAIVVDDQAICLDWAEEAGARVIQARLMPNAPEPEFPVVLTRLTDLTQLVNSLSR